MEGGRDRKKRGGCQEERGGGGTRSGVGVEGERLPGTGTCRRMCDAKGDGKRGVGLGTWGGEGVKEGG